MNVEHSIPKKRGLSDPNSFSALRKEGIRLVQQMSGDVWTDYNLHDPGVTILEQLCFALTDLIYRSDFSVEDQLTGDDGKIAFSDQALHRPEDILPCRPSTAADYRQLILDSCPDVDIVWVDASADANRQPFCPGIHAVTVRPFSRSGTGSIQAEIKKSFVSERNLCEDIHESIVALDDLECCLLGTVEIDGSHDSSDVLGQIYHRAVSYIAANAQRRQPQDHREDAETLIDSFTGPRSAHGRSQPGDAGSQNDKVILADLVGMLQDIQGVVRVQNLAIRVLHPDHPRPYRDYVSRRHGDAALWLRVPEPGDTSTAEIEGVNLLKNGRLITAPIADTWNKLYQLITADRSSRMKHADPAALYTLPAGVKRNFRNYFSIQNHFPDNYGINADGVPASAPAETRAQAKQLKAYLMLFEQVIANHLANVDNVRELFANAGRRGPTYRHQVLPDAADDNPDKLSIAENSGEFLAQVLAEFDESSERKSRQLDHMLAVFGESHSQKSLRHVDYYSSTQNPYEEIAKNKAAYLERIIEVTRDRIGGVDYLSGDSVGGFARRVGLLLGFRQHGGSLTAILREKNVDPGGPATELKRPGASGVAGSDPDFGEPVMRLDSASMLAWRNAWPDAWRIAGRDAWKILREGDDTQLLFADGTVMENYRLVPPPRSTDRWTLVINSTTGRTRRLLATFKDKARGERAANVLYRFLIALSRKSEGLHVVEHVLLRPMGARNEHADQQPDWDRLKIDDNDPIDQWRDFYPLRFSVFFPDWTARCRDPNFRLLAEETVRVNSPAHVYGQCFWLNYGQMCEFETLADDWAYERRQSEAHPSAIDERAVKLIDFVLSMQESVCKSKQAGHD